MSFEHLKGKPPYPFHTICMAVAFSPRWESLLSESAFLSRLSGAKLVLIHVGEKTTTKEQKILKALEARQYDISKAQIIWKKGNTVKGILEACKENAADLLVLGALRRENLLNFYLGSVARTICRRAKCSILLLENPRHTPAPFKKVFVHVSDNPKTPHTLQTAEYLAGLYGFNAITAVREIDFSGVAMATADSVTAGDTTRTKREISQTEEDSLHHALKVFKDTGLEIKEKTIKGKPGFALSNYTREKKADLLIINSPDQKLGFLDRVFTHDLEFILEDLPNVLIVHSRINANTSHE
jgi:nucleotide-binding universal stress UspA family protein